MVKDIIVIGPRDNEPRYINGKIIKIHEENIYDVRLPNGQIETYVENVSGIFYNSGDYVVTLIIGSNETRSCKIIGRGRKITNYNLIEEVSV